MSGNNLYKASKKNSWDIDNLQLESALGSFAEYLTFTNAQEAGDMSRSGRKVIFVVVDGMRDDTAALHLGYLEGLVEQKAGLRARVQSVLPSMSRPCYEAILTGTQPVQNGIVGNDIVRETKMGHVFQQVRAAQKVSAVVAYYWMSELFRRAPFDLVNDIEQDNQETSFQFGRFYFEDSFPDSHTFSQAEKLRLQHQPDFLLIHPMGVDDAGHRHGSDSKQYQVSVAKMGMILARLLPRWEEDGYLVLITSDHGMNSQGFHGGTDAGERIVPLYVFGGDLGVTGVQDELLNQTVLAHLLCKLMGIEAAAAMARFPEPLYQQWFGTSFAPSPAPSVYNS